jgi:hypothetical protein
LPTTSPTAYPTTFPTQDTSANVVVRAKYNIDGLTGDEFNSNIAYSVAFKSAVASETGVSESAVTITSIEDHSSRRRLSRRLDGHAEVAIEFMVVLTSDADSSSVSSAIDAIAVSTTFGNSFSAAFTTAAAGTGLTLPTISFSLLEGASTTVADTMVPTHTPTAAPSAGTPAPTPARTYYAAMSGLTPREKAALALCLVIGILVMVAGACYLKKAHAAAAGKGKAYKQGGASAEEEPVQHGALDSELGNIPGDQANVDVVAIDV